MLLIDADMRRPRLHSVFNIENGVGLSTLLSSETSEAEALNAVKLEPGTKLNLLTSGPIPPNPAELIGSEQMADLLKIFQNNFTHVVVDSPPIASFTFPAGTRARRVRAPSHIPTISTYGRRCPR